MHVQFKVFQSTTKSWEKLFAETAAFASEIGPKRLISISQSEGRDGTYANGVVTVWYWDTQPES